MSKLSRVVRFIFAIWIVAFLLAAPQAFQFGVVDFDGGHSKHCTIKKPFFDYAFEISSFLFFFVPMTIICVLYILIGIKLRKSKLLYGKKLKNVDNNKCISGQTRVVRMLIVLVCLFFLCWAPFHAQRIMAIYGRIMHKSERNRIFLTIYAALTYISGILYFLSTCINPLLYNIMSHKFRNASKLTLFVHCVYNTKKNMTPTNYSALSLKYGHGGSGRQSLRSAPVHHLSNEYDDIEIKNLANGDDVRTNTTINCNQPILPFLADTCQIGMANPSSRQNFHGYVVVDGTASSSSRQTSTTSLSRNNSSSSTRFNSNSSFKKSFRGHKKMPVVYTPPVLTPTKKSSTFTERVIDCARRILFLKPRDAAHMKLQVENQIKDMDEKLTRTAQKINESNSTNTISNSSLREVDEEELNSAELAEYLAEMRRKELN